MSSFVGNTVSCTFAFTLMYSKHRTLIDTKYIFILAFVLYYDSCVYIIRSLDMKNNMIYMEASLNKILPMKAPFSGSTSETDQ